jgi:hypothetical protein
VCLYMCMYAYIYVERKVVDSAAGLSMDRLSREQQIMVIAQLQVCV